ncbi:TX1B3 protein, partial [Polypterus senegalus]
MNVTAKVSKPLDEVDTQTDKLLMVVPKRSAKAWMLVFIQDTHKPRHSQRIEIHKLRHGENLILGFSIGGGIDQDPGQNPYTEDKTDKGIYVTRVTEGGPAEVAGLLVGDKIMQVNGWDMTMVTHDQARKRLTKKNEDVVRLLVTRKSLQDVVRQSMLQ